MLGATCRWPVVRRAATGKACLWAIILALCAAPAMAVDMACVHSEDPNHRFAISGDEGVYVWDDHGIARSVALKCFTQSDGATTCHRWEQRTENGRSAMIYRMLPDGTLIEAGAWAMLDVSRIVATAGFECVSSER